MSEKAENLFEKAQEEELRRNIQRAQGIVRRKGGPAIVTDMWFMNEIVEKGLMDGTFLETDTFSPKTIQVMWLYYRLTDPASLLVMPDIRYSSQVLTQLGSTLSTAGAMIAEHSELYAVAAATFGIFVRDASDVAGLCVVPLKMGGKCEGFALFKVAGNLIVAMLEITGPTQALLETTYAQRGHPGRGIVLSYRSVSAPKCDVKQK